MYTIRNGGPADVPGIVAVARETWAATYAGIIPAEVQARFLDQAYDPEAMARRAAAGWPGFFVAVDDATGEVVGFINLGPRTTPGDAELWRIYVRPAHQSNGLGRRLLAAALDDLRARRPVERVYVQVERENAIGRAFYDRLGFVALREYEEDLLGFPSAMVEMCLKLSDPSGVAGG